MARKRAEAADRADERGKERGHERTSDRLARKVSFRVGEDDWRVYSARVEASGLSPSEYFRHCIVTHRTELLVGSRRPLVLHAINKAGLNLNRIALAVHAAHRAGQVSDKTFLSVVDHLSWIEQFLQGLVGRDRAD